MPISYTYKTVFIHIPKCAGTTIEKMLGTCTPIEYYNFKPRLKPGQLKTPQHFTYCELKSGLTINWENFYAFSVVRNPYSRFVSEYKYRKDLFLKTKNPEHDPVTFEAFIEKLNIDINERIRIFDGHLETQSGFLKNESGAIESSIEIFKFENMTPCWEMLTSKTLVEYKNYIWSNKSSDVTPYQDFFTPETKNTIYNFYKEDFDNFGYSSEL